MRSQEFRTLSDRSVTPPRVMLLIMRIVCAERLSLPEGLRRSHAAVDASRVWTGDQPWLGENRSTKINRAPIGDRTSSCEFHHLARLFFS